MPVISDTQIQMPNYLGIAREGFDYGQAKSEEKRRRPILEQLEQLKLQQTDQATRAGSQKISLNEYALKDAKRKQESDDMSDFGQGAAWAMNQQNPEAAWEQVLNQFETEGKPVQPFRGRTDLMPMIRDLNNPDYAKQQAIQNNLKNLIQTMPPGMQAQAQALGQASPQALYKAAGEGMFRGDTAGQLDKLTTGLSEKNKEAVTATYAVDPDEAVKLRARLALQEGKPKKPLSEGAKKAKGFLHRMDKAEGLISDIIGEGYTPSALDRFAVGGDLTNWAASSEGKRYWNAAAEWYRAKLRGESGASISIPEAREEARSYFPVAGDDADTVAQKEQLRITAMESIGFSAEEVKTEVKTPKGFIDNGDGTFTMPDGTIVRRKK